MKDKYSINTKGTMMSQYTQKLLGGVVGAALLSGSVIAQADGFDLSDKLSVSGFIDMSTTYSETDDVAPTSRNSGLDQFELNFLYTFDDALTATVDLEYQDNGAGEEVDIEQAYFNYNLADGLDFKAGRFLSYSGWETEDPTGLMQYSGTGYAKYFYGGYQQGMSVKYGNDVFDVAASLVNDLGDLEGEARDSTRPGLETMIAGTLFESWTIKLFYSIDSLEDPVTGDDTGEDTTMVNFWTSYAVGGFTVALELNSSENAGASGVDTEATGNLLLLNYAQDSWGITLRTHAWEVEDAAGDTTEEMSGITVSPSYAVSENLLLVAEVRVDTDDIADADTTSYALEALITW